MKKAILISSVLITVIIGYLYLSTYKTGKVIRVVDGDTFVMQPYFGGNITVRMDCIDAPEHNQEFGSNSKNALSGYILGRKVELTITGHDKYKRSLAMVYLSGTNINLKMVSNGFAWDYRKYCTDERFSQAEKKAKQLHMGLWLNLNAVNPYLFRKFNYN
ncbi:MAG: thermonuclease family protein [Bacteroidia bacterium]